MKRKKKTLKGMTLYEMIISIAIFAIMCGVLVGVGMQIDRTTRATNNLKNKIVKEAPYAANKLKQEGGVDVFEAADITDMQIKISVEDGHGNVESKTVYYYDKTDGKKKQQTRSAQITLDAKKYSTKKIADDPTDTRSAAEKAADPNGLLDLEFVEIEPTTAPTT